MAESLLQGKKILFVDDSLPTIQLYLENLEKAEAEVEFAESLAEAMALLKGKLYDAVVIDLYVPPIPAELVSYEKGIGELNQGQSLGRYLREKHPQTPYCYLSVVPNVFDANLEIVPEEVASWFVLNKMDIKPRQIIAPISQLITQWPYPKVAR